MTVFTGMRSLATDRARRPLRRLSFSTLILGGLLSGCVTPAAAQIAFERRTIVTGSAQRQTILTGFLLGGAVAEVAAVHVDENGDRRVRIHAFDDGAWTPALDATLHPDVSFVDVARIGGRDRLVTYQPGRLHTFDPESATERVLVAVTSNFSPPRRGEIPHVDVSRDVNDDGRDDLVVPDVDGFRLFVQMSDGAFADPVQIGAPTGMGRIYGADGYRFDPWSQSRVHEIDYNGDGRSDLAFWNGDRFEVHHQDERGLFAPSAAAFTTDVGFDADDPSWLATGDMTGRVLHSLTDLNGDGVPDLVVVSLEGSRASNKRSACEVHFGMRAPDGGVLFGRTADAVIRSEGVQLGMDRHDLDRDGQVDMVFTTIEAGFLRNSFYRRFRGFMGGEIHLHVEFYRMRGGLYADVPDATRRINLQYPGAHRGPGWVPLDMALRGGKHERRNTQEGYRRAFNSILLIGDVTGDGRADLLVGRDRGEPPGPRRHADDRLQVFAGVPGPDLFSRRPEEVAVALPEDEEYTWLVDLDADGRQDVLLHHPSTTNEAHRVTMLIAR